MSVSEQQNHTEIDEMLENSEAVSEETLSEETVEKVSEGTSEETKTSAVLPRSLNFYGFYRLCEPPG